MIQTRNVLGYSVGDTVVVMAIAGRLPTEVNDTLKNYFDIQNIVRNTRRAVAAEPKPAISRNRNTYQAVAEATPEEFQRRILHRLEPELQRFINCEVTELTKSLMKSAIRNILINEGCIGGDVEISTNDGNMRINAQITRPNGAIEIITTTAVLG